MMRRHQPPRERHLGFDLDEVMAGYHEFEPGQGPPGRHRFRFKVRWGHDDLWLAAQQLGADTRCHLRGTVTAEGLCHESPCAGSLTLDYRGRHIIRYSFHFKVGGEGYRYVGEKVNIQPWNLPTSHTTCFGTITRESDHALVSRGVAFFKLRTLPGFLASLRLRFGRTAATS